MLRVKSRPWLPVLHSAQLSGLVFCPSLSNPPPLCAQQLYAVVLSIALGGEGLGVDELGWEERLAVIQRPYLVILHMGARVK